MATKKETLAYTIVQHSGYGYKRDGTFKQGLETRSLKTSAELGRIAKAGGKLFSGADAYIQAENYAQAEMYPPEVQGLVPRAPGTFSTQTVDGLRIYVPKGAS